MKVHIVSAVVIVMISLVAHTPAREATQTSDEIKAAVGYSPRECIQRMVRQQTATLDRIAAREKQLANEPVTNWQEYDVTYYDVHWRPVYLGQWIYGEVGIYCYPTVASLDSVIVNLDSALIIDSVYNASGLLTFVSGDNHLKVFLERAYLPNELIGFSVVYHGQPNPGLEYWGGLTFDPYHGNWVIESLAEPYMARQWWPCNDIPADKADSIDVHITVDTGKTVSSNGLLVSDVDNNDGTHTLHWRHRYPIATYLVCMAVADYVQWNDYYVYGPNDSMLIMNYSLPDVYASTQELLSMAPEVLSVLSGLFGEYPFIDEKYGQTLTIMNGMEHQTNTFISRDTAYPDFQKYVLIHEMGHHWWGDLVTCHDWHNAWLNEGFATYSDALYHEAVYGFQTFKSYMGDMDNFVDGSLYTEDTTDIFWGIFDYRVYAKGAWVVHMLRHVVGDSVFFAILHTYREAYAYGTATTGDFQSVCESVSGLDLDQFFQQWVYGIGRPYYRHAYYTEPSDSGGWDTYIAIRQEQETGPPVFVMPIDIKLRTTGDTALFTLFNDQQEQNYVVHTANQVLSMYFDRDHWILRDELWEQYRLRILTDSLSDGVQYEPYEDTIVVKGVYPGHDMVCEVISGNLPPGWSLESSTGIVFGECRLPGTFTFMVRATDEIYSESYRDSSEYTVDIAPGLERPGDANADGDVNVGDAVYLVNYIFKGGPPLPIPNWADANADCTVNIADAVYLVNFIFKGGPEPQIGCVE